MIKIPISSPLERYIGRGPKQRCFCVWGACVQLGGTWKPPGDECRSSLEKRKEGSQSWPLGFLGRFHSMVLID